MSEPAPNDGGGSGSIIIAVGGMIAFAFIFLFVYVLFGPMLLVCALIAVGFISFGALHYVLWGRSMPEDNDAD